MLLILSENQDQTTNHVIDWLTFNNVLFKRVNGEKNFLNCEIRINCSEQLFFEFYNISNERICLNDFTSFWYRRNNFSIAMPAIKTHKKQTLFALKKEWEQIQGFIHLYFDEKVRLGSFQSESAHNKLFSLKKAVDCKLKIPDTLVSTQKLVMQNFVKSGVSITKAIWNMFSIMTKTYLQTIGTEIITERDIEEKNEITAPTLLQKNIIKSYELRIFFIKNELYAMAIFSQNDEKTKIDFRNYNRQKPNRNIPFELPVEIKSKIINFINSMNLDTGSIDMIVTPNNEFVFLEVNPIGQFGWVSKNCNYYLEKKVANYFNLKNYE